MSDSNVMYPRALAAAIANQAGKGEARHGNGLPFMQQPWRRYADVHGVGFLTGQAHKKWEEAISAHERGTESDGWVDREMAGALAYGLMAIGWKRATLLLRDTTAEEMFRHQWEYLVAQKDGLGEVVCSTFLCDVRWLESYALWVNVLMIAHHLDVRLAARAVG